jgi:CDP-diacylglycerol--serine O-phosphatidyltransferase
MKKRRIKKVNIASLTHYSFLPSVFTLLNLFLGFQALLHIISSKKNFNTAIYYLMASVIMDGFDGTIARLTKTESNFGVQLDSLVDAVTFGLVTSILLYQWGFQFGHPQVGKIVSFVFLSAGLIRLARFNVFKDAQAYPANVFIGMPIPTASMAICSIVLVFGNKPPKSTIGVLLFSLAAVLVSLLMISNIKYKTIKRIVLKNSLKMLFLLALIIACLVIFPDITLPILSFSYVSSPLFFHLFAKRQKSGPSAGVERTEGPPAGKTES